MPTEQPFFTVVVPVYKGLDFLPRCVQSVLTQSFADFELILVDDGSPDESGLLCDQLALQDSRIHSVHKPNGGIASARNAGIKAGQGRYLLFLDQDDRYAPGAFALIYENVIKNQIHLVSWPYGLGWCDTPLPTSGPCFYTQAEMGLYYQTESMSCVWTKAYDMAFLKKHKLYFDETIRDGTDDPPFSNAYLRAWFTAHPAAGIQFLGYYLYCYEVNNQASVSNRPQPYQQSHLTMFADLMADMQQLYHSPLADQALLYRRCLQTLAYGIYSSPTSAWPSFRAELLRSKELAGILRCMKNQKFYSPFYLPFRLKSARLVAHIFRLFEKRNHFYWKFYWLSYYLLGGNWQRE